MGETAEAGLAGQTLFSCWDSAGRDYTCDQQKSDTPRVALTVRHGDGGSDGCALVRMMCVVGEAPVYHLRVKERIYVGVIVATITADEMLAAFTDLRTRT
jgi:hypothetical protein